jgi:regulator of sigma E protease
VSVLYFLVLVGVLVLVHELGHFAAAKLLDVKVLRFSIGYGRPLVRVKVRETEYQIGIFPLGGYVRILGVEDEEPAPGDAGRSFQARPLWQRLAIVFAGPMSNFLLATVVFFVFFAGDTMLPAAVVGDVIEDSPAAKAGIEPGDRVLAIDGHGVRYWEDLEGAVQRSAGKELHLRLERKGKVFEKYVVPVEEVARKRCGTPQAEGRVGITRAPFAPLVGVLDEHSPAYLAGLRTGDLIISLDGEPIGNWGDVARKLDRNRPTLVAYYRGTEVPGIPNLALYAASTANLVPEYRTDDKGSRYAYTGLERAEMFIAHVDPGTPADVAGLRPGDLITAIDGAEVHHWLTFDQKLQSSPEKGWEISYQRTGPKGDVLTDVAHVTQVRRKQLDEYGHTQECLVFGARNDAQRSRGEMVPNESRFTYAVSKAVDRTTTTIKVMVTATGKILAGDSPSESLGGPVAMYKAASVSGDQGLESFLWLMAIISVNLGLLNLLPIPVLDGGHVLVFVIEGVKRKPLTAAQREKVQLAGLIFLGAVTILALRNDIWRYFL